MTDKAIFWPKSNTEGYIPPHCIATSESLAAPRSIKIDWSKGYEYWQPDCLDDKIFEDETGDYNMILFIPYQDKKLLVWVNRIDFDFIMEE